MDVDVHKVITTLFNVEMNPFIARFSKVKSIERVRTGGLWEVRVAEEDAFNRYAYWLKTFRDELFSKSVRWSLPVDSFREELEPLSQFCVNVKNLIELDFFEGDNQAVLTDYLVNPLIRFFNSLDRHFRTTHFRRSLKLSRSQHELVIKVVDSSNSPIPQVEALISYVLAPDLGEHSRAIFLCRLRTDEAGIAKTKLPKGHYKIDVREYGRTSFENLSEDKEITFTIPKLKIRYFIATIIIAICIIILLVLILTSPFHRLDVLKV